MERLNAHAAELYALGVPVVLAGDYNVVPTDFDIYPTNSYAKNALVQPEAARAVPALLDQGWVDAIRTLHPDEPMYTFWDYMRNRWPRDAGLRTRPSAAERRGREAPGRRGRRSRRARRGERERSCSGLDRAERRDNAAPRETPRAVDERRAEAKRAPPAKSPPRRSDRRAPSAVRCW